MREPLSAAMAWAASRPRRHRWRAPAAGGCGHRRARRRRRVRLDRSRAQRHRLRGALPRVRRALCERDRARQRDRRVSGCPAGRSSMTEFVVTAPASSANLGAGFDSVGIGIEIRMTARVRVVERGALPAWEYGGLHPPTHDGIRGCVEAGIARILPRPPALAVTFENDIPLGAGLGSSAAAYAIGVAIGARLSDRSPDDDVLARAVAELEGHPDNALAAWYGGSIVAALSDDGLTSLRFPALDAGLAVVVPDLMLPTPMRARCCRAPTSAATRSTTSSGRRCWAPPSHRGGSKCWAPPCATASISRIAPTRSRACVRSSHWTTRRSLRSPCPAPGRPCWPWCATTPPHRRADAGGLRPRRSRQPGAHSRVGKPRRGGTSGRTGVASGREGALAAKRTRRR